MENSQDIPAVPQPNADSVAAFSCRFYRPGDEEGLLRLLQRGFPGWPVVETPTAAIDYLRWKIRADENPPPVHALIEGDAGILGASLSFVQRFKIGERIFDGRQGTDLVIDPDYRRQGIGRQLLDFGAQEYLRYYEFELHVGSRSRDPAMSSVRSRVYGSSDAFANEVDVLQAPLSLANVRATRRQVPSRIVDASRFDARVDEFWKNAGDPFDFIVVRDKDYLNWRYADRRGGEFAIRLAESSGRLLGYSVLRKQRNTGYIADLLALPGRADVVESLLDDALTWFRSAGATSGRCWAPHGHPYGAALQRAGFLHRRRPRHITYRMSAHAEEARVLQEPGSVVHLMIGDSDLI